MQCPEGLEDSPLKSCKPNKKVENKQRRGYCSNNIFTVPFLLKVSGVDLVPGKVLALIEEGVLGSTTKPRSSSLLSEDFDLLCLK